MYGRSRLHHRYVSVLVSSGTIRYAYAFGTSRRPGNIFPMSNPEESGEGTSARLGEPEEVGSAAVSANFRWCGRPA